MYNKNAEETNLILLKSGSDVKKCMRCGKCTAGCPSFDEMEYHPHQFVYMVEKGDIDKLMQSESIYKCLSCFACVDRCPRGVDPANVVEAIRVKKISAQGMNRLKPEQIPCVLDENMPQQAIVSAFRKYKR